MTMDKAVLSLVVFKIWDIPLTWVNIFVYFLSLCLYESIKVWLSVKFPWLFE